MSCNDELLRSAQKCVRWAARFPDVCAELNSQPTGVCAAAALGSCAMGRQIPGKPYTCTTLDTFKARRCPGTRYGMQTANTSSMQYATIFVVKYSVVVWLKFCEI